MRKDMNGVATAAKPFELRKPDSPDADTRASQEGRSLMARIDAKVAEQVTLSKGTIALVAVGMVLLQVVFNYGGSLLGWARDDQSQKERIAVMASQQEELRRSISEINTKIDTMNQAKQTEAVSNARAEGYKLGLADAHGTKEK